MGKSRRIRQKGSSRVPFLTHRSEGINVLDSSPFVWVFDGGNYGHGNDGWNIGDHSVMVDYVSDMYEASDHPVQACDHLHITKAFGPKTVQTDFDWFPFQGTTTWSFNRHGAMSLNLATLDTERLAPTPPDSVLRKHSRKAFKEMLQQFPAEISLPNTLMELKDVPGCLDTIRDVAGVISRGVKKRQAPSVQTAANIHAGYNFGISPLIGDIIKIDSVYKNVHGRLEHLLRTRGKWTQVGSKSTHSMSHNVEIGFSEAALGEYVRWTTTNVSYEITSSAMIRNDLSWVDSWEGIVRGLVSAMGLNNPLAVAWEATPFSWAIDYVVPVGDWLETFQFQQIEGWQVKRLCTSWKAKVTVNVEIHPRGGSWKSLGEYEITRYVRNVGLPPMFGDIQSPNAKQTSLLAAVALGRT